MNYSVVFGRFKEVWLNLRALGNPEREIDLLTGGGRSRVSYSILG